MNKQREALELAQKAIAAIELTDDFELTVKASRAIREALAEQEQEPLTDGELYAAFLIGLNSKKPVRKPLTDEEIDALRQSAQNLNFVTLREFKVIARAIERAHGIE